MNDVVGEPARESRVSMIEAALGNLMRSIKGLEELLGSFDGSPMDAKTPPPMEAAKRSEFGLWDSLPGEINIAAEAISKSKDYLRERMR